MADEKAAVRKEEVPSTPLGQNARLGGNVSTPIEYSSIDERTGPFLAAIAFFMTGGITALLNANIRAADFVFPDGAVLPLPLIFIAFSLLLAGLAAMSLILSLGPPEPPPLRPDGVPDGRADGVPESGDVSRVGADSHLPVSARHAWYKYERIVEARAFFFLSLPFFLLGLLTTLFVLVSDPPAGPQRFSWHVSLIGGIIILLLTFVAGNDRARIESLGDDVEGDSRAFSVLAACLSISAFLSFLTSGTSGYWYPALSAVGVLAVTFWGYRTLAVRRKRRAAGGYTARALDNLQPAFLFALQAPALVGGFVPGMRASLVLISLIPLGIFEGSRLVYGYAGITKRDYWKTAR